MKQCFKRSTAWLLCLAMVLGLFAGIPGLGFTKARAEEQKVTVEEINLLESLNPSFEDYQIPGWTIDKTLGGVAQSKNEDGTWSLKMYGNGANITSDKVTIWGYWAGVASAQILGAGKVSMIFYGADGAVLETVSSDAVTTTEWQTVSVSAVAPVDAVAVAVKVTSTSDTETCVDNASLKEGTQRTWTIPNADFNEGFATGVNTWKYTGAAASKREVVELNGNNVMSITTNNTAFNFYGPALSGVVPGLLYTFSIDVQIPVTGSLQLYLDFYADAECTTRVKRTGTSVTETTTPDGEWGTISVYAEAPAGAYYVRPYIHQATATTGTFYFDNARFGLSTGLIDPSFEANIHNGYGVPHGWWRSSSSAGETTINKDAAYINDGKASFIIDDMIQARAYDMNITANEIYTFSILAKTPLSAEEWKGLVYVQMYFYDATGAVIKGASKVSYAAPNNADWTEISVTQTAPANAKRMRVAFQPVQTDGALCYVDSASLTSAKSNLLSNAAFEEREGTDNAMSKWLSGNYKQYTTVEYEPGRGYVAHMTDAQMTGMQFKTEKVSVIGGHKYTASADVKAIAGTGYVQMYIWYYNDAGTKVDSADSPKYISLKEQDGTWRHLEYALTAPDTAATAIVLFSLASEYGNDASDNVVYPEGKTMDITLDNVALWVNCDHEVFTEDEELRVAPTCTNVGYEYEICDDCGAKQITEIAALGHDYVATETVAPNCTDQGYTIYACNRENCDATKQDNYIDAVGTAHVWVKNDDGSYACEKCDIAPVYLDVENNNLVLNPSFEEYTIPGWTIEAGVAQTKNADGTWSLKINVNGASAISDAVSAAAGYAYTASAKTEGGKVNILFYDAEGKILAESEAEAVAPAGTVKAAVKLSSASDEAVYFDDVALAMGSVVQPVLSNADMATLNSKGLPTGWTVAGEATAEVVADAERGNVVQYTREANDYNLLSPHFAVVPGLTYAVTLDIWQDVTSYGQFYIKFFDAEGKEIKETTINDEGKEVVTWSAHRFIVIDETLAANEWHTLQVSGIAPANAVTARIQIVSVYGAKNQIVSTVKLGNATAQVSTGLYNASFEDNAVQASGLPMGSTYRETEKDTNYGWINNTIAKDGTQSIALVSETYVFTNFISVIPGQTYTATADVITDAEHLPEWAAGYYGEDSQCWFKTYLYFYDARGTQLPNPENTADVPTTDNWTTVTNTDVAPEGAVAARLMFETTRGAVAYVDNITFTKAESNITLTNADFEEKVTGNYVAMKDWTANTNYKDFTNVEFEAGRGYYAHIIDAESVTVSSARLAAEAGAKYKLTFEAKADTVNTQFIQALIKFYGDPDGDGEQNDLQSKIPESTKYVNISQDKKNLPSEWTEFSIILTAPEGTETVNALFAITSLYHRIDADGNGEVDTSVYDAITDVSIDNVTITKICDTHNWGAPVVNDPTCVEDGTVVYTCSDCGAIGTAEGEKSKNEHTVPTAGHKDYIEPSLDKPGYYVYDCAVCGEEFTIEDANAPQLEAVADVDGTEYATIEEAVAALVDNATLTLKKDIDLTQYGTSFKLISKALNGVTIDGDGHKFIGVVRLQPAAECTDLTIENVIFSTGDIAGDKKTLLDESGNKVLDENGNEVKVDITDDVGYLVVSTGTYVNLTIQNCQFLDGAYISQSNPEIENLTIDSCLFDGCTNPAGTASAVVLKNINNAVINNNTIRNIQWNAFQIGYSTGVFDFTENTIDWSVPEGNEPDGVFNLYSFTDAEVYLDGNTVTGTCVDAGRSVVQFQYDDTANVALFDYDGLTVTHKAEDGTTDIFKNVDYIEDEECTRYCTGHIYDEEGFCTVCYAEKPEEHEHSYEYVDNGNNTHDKVCSGCNEVAIDDELHSYNAEHACACGHTLFEMKSGSSATLKAMLQLDFIINPEQMTGTDNYAILTRTYADGVNKGTVDQIRIDQADWAKYDENGRLAASYTKIAAKEMGDEVTIVLYNAQGQQLSVPKTDSIKGYAYRGLNALASTTNAKNIKLRTTLADMLNYGAAAQKFFNYDVENPVNAAMTDTQQSWATAEDVATSNNADNGTGGRSRTLTLESAIQLDFIFYANVVGAESEWANRYAIATYKDHYGNTKTVRVEGTDFMLYKGEDVQVSVVGMAVADYQSMVTCVVYNSEGEEVGRSVDSMEGYANRATNAASASETLKDVLKALMKFGAAADAYF